MKTIPTGRLHAIYLKGAYDKDVVKICNATWVSVIIDESPDITGVPTMNTLQCYYSKKKNHEEACCFGQRQQSECFEQLHSGQCSQQGSPTVGKMWKMWKYMAVARLGGLHAQNGQRNLQKRSNAHVDVKDSAHPIHASVDHAIYSPCVSNVWSQ